MSATAAAFLAIGLALFVAGVVAWKAKTQHRATVEPEAALSAPRHRAHDASDPPEVAWVRALDADTLTHLQLAALIEKAAEANARLGGPAGTSPPTGPSPKEV